jgi:ketosteroid isomerase-like protein
MTDNMQHAEDLAIVTQLNLDYIHSDEHSDAKRFSEFLSEDFITQTPGVTRNRDEYLEYIAKPRPLKDITLEDVQIRMLGDVALVHGAVTYTMIATGKRQDALYTDVYQKREGTWLCIAACAIAPGA